ncbi:fimbrial biogenesis chaperone [Pseudomonas schmalbachii]|uniref:Molecular chaperone n=1 Tax=Pseudomonas schmalbachii TaxID=2816993 RepID=A0ABS3TUJ7_9PSED|nr:molecular chaperone [Pseudomonas schmalbachii]MBO3277028.1 molecular chaperone [Pseudomonas schmalbachii]
MSSRALVLLGLLLVLAGQGAWAGVTAERTRVIVPEGVREVSLLLANVNEYPVVTQTWIDDGSLDSTPDKAVAPLMPLPAMFRMEPGERRSLRLLFTGGDLPADRESLFWLNIYEIPPKPKGPLPPESSRLTVTMRTQMKVFYRPKHLEPSSEEAISRLGFSLQQKAGKPLLRINNPTPYHVTLVGLELRNGATSQSAAGDMLAPFSQLDVPLTEALPGKGTQVVFSWIDDDGINQQRQIRIP